jgi:hypothetical protein
MNVQDTTFQRRLPSRNIGEHFHFKHDGRHFKHVGTLNTMVVKHLARKAWRKYESGAKMRLVLFATRNKCFSHGPRLLRDPRFFYAF